MSYPTPHEDPAIAQVALLEAIDIWGDLEARMRDGVDFYLAREVALATRVPMIRKQYGQDVARRAEIAVMTRDPATVSKATKAALKGGRRQWLLDHLAKTGRTPTILDRICLRLFGCLW